MSQIPSGPRQSIGLAYASPPAGPSAEIRRIAMQQRAINFCILAYFATICLTLLLPQPLMVVASVLAVGVIITGAVFAFMLAISLYDVLYGLTLGILTMIPFLGLIPLLIINSRATAVLRRRGLRVGLFGARIPKSQTP